MLSKRYESTEIDRKTWLHVPSGTPWSTGSDTHQVVDIKKETSTKIYTPFYRQKGGDLTQSYEKSPYTNRNVKGAK